MTELTALQIIIDTFMAENYRYTKRRVRTGPGKPGKSWNIIMSFSRSGKSWKKATGPGKFWKSVKLN